MQAGFGKPKPKKEAVDVPERKPEDKSLDKLLNVRKQRMDRLERERREAREAWKGQRAALHDMKQRWREAKQAAKDYWAQARSEFLSMTMTSGQYQRAKAAYERMKQEAAKMHTQCHEMVVQCKNGRRTFFDARESVLKANRQQEKLTILRDEIRLQNQQQDI